MSGPHFELSADGRTLVVHVPMEFRRRGGRKQVVLPEGVMPDTPPMATGESVSDDSPIMTLALARAWSRRIDAGDDIDDIVRSEKRSASYVHRVLRLNLLAPDIVAAIVAGTWRPAMPLTRLIALPADWAAQRGLLGFNP